MTNIDPKAIKNSEEYTSLTATEIEILKRIKQGLSSSQIAKERRCSSRTIEKHRSNIIKKLGLPSAQNALYVYLLENTDL